MFIELQGLSSKKVSEYLNTSQDMAFFTQCELSKSTTFNCTIFYTIFPHYDIRSANFFLTYGPQEKVPYSFTRMRVPDFVGRCNSHFLNVWLYL